MQETTFIVAILLGAGFAVAKLGQLFRLPSVTGYILAGLILGPSGLNLVTGGIVGDHLSHFTQIALMLIAFGIGEHLDLSRLRHILKSIGIIGLAETSGAFLFVSASTFFLTHWIRVGPESWGMKDFAVLSILLGAVAVATAPAATLHVMRELKAAGPLTTTLMAVVAVDDGLAIMMFGIAVSACEHIAGNSTGSAFLAFSASLIEIFGSLLLGIFTGMLIDSIISKLRSKSEMLTVGLALLLLCGEGARLLDLSPLLAGMAAGFTIVNRDFRDVRLFRAINAFEPPIYVLFFTLAGTQLHLSALFLAGWIGLAYFFFRVFGKMAGSFVGAFLANSPSAVQKYLGFALVPQAGVAIGLIFLIKDDPQLSVFSSIITPVVLAGVVMSEIVGPVLARFAVEKAGEAAGRGRESIFPELSQKNGEGEFQLLPWTWELLQPAAAPQGYVLFGTAHLSTARGLARMATILAHHHGALPLAVHVTTPQESDNKEVRDEVPSPFSIVENEVNSLGYRMDTETVLSDNVASGIVATAEKYKTWGIVLGYPSSGTAQAFQNVVESVADMASCQVIVVRFAGVLHTERILVPIIRDRDLQTVSGVIAALSGVGRHRITILRLMDANVSEQELTMMERNMLSWAGREKLLPYIHCRVVTTSARLASIVQESLQHDLIVMAASETQGLQRFFFGSLAEGVAQVCERPMIMVYNPRT